MVDRLVLPERAQLTGVHQEDRAALERPRDRQVVARGEGVHLRLVAVDDDADRLRVVLQVIGKVGADARGVRARGKDRPGREEEKPRGCDPPYEGVPWLRVLDAVAHVLLHRPPSVRQPNRGATCPRSSCRRPAPSRAARVAIRPASLSSAGALPVCGCKSFGETRPAAVRRGRVKRYGRYEARSRVLTRFLVLASCPPSGSPNRTAGASAAAGSDVQP